VRDRVWQEIVLRLERGEAWAEVEHELDEASPGLSEDERDALWLSAWSYRPGQERAAERLLALVGR
jgi:hypothetical protein